MEDREKRISFKDSAEETFREFSAGWPFGRKLRWEVEMLVGRIFLQPAPKRRGAQQTHRRLRGTTPRWVQRSKGVIGARLPSNSGRIKGAEGAASSRPSEVQSVSSWKTSERDGAAILFTRLSSPRNPFVLLSVDFC